MKKDVIDENRAVALDRAFVASRLLDEKYFPKVLNALTVKGVKGKEIFGKVCLEAEIPEDMIHPLWNSLVTYTQHAKAPWAPC